MYQKAPVYSEKKFLELLAPIYDAASDASRWSNFLQKYADLLQGVAPALYVQNLDSQQVSFNETLGYDPYYLKQYSEYYSTRNVWLLKGGTAIMKPGKMILGEMILSYGDLKKTEYYNDWLAPQGHLYSFGATIMQEGPVTSLFSMFRSPNARDFDESDVIFTERLIPHIKRAVQIHQQLSGLTSERNAGMEMIAGLNVGVILLNKEWQVIFINRYAEELVSVNDGLGVRHNMLEPALSDEKTMLRRFIGGAIETSRGAGVQPGGSMTISRQSGLRPFSVLITPIHPDRHRIGPQTAMAALFIQDPEKKVMTIEEGLRVLYMLTPAEAKLAAILTEGFSLRSAAERLGIRFHTARDHLKRIFSKTQTRRQTELMRLVLSGPAVFNRFRRSF